MMNTTTITFDIMGYVPDSLTLGSVLLFHECFICGNRDYNLSIDFIDGDIKNKSISNIRLVCSKCAGLVELAYTADLKSAAE